MGCEKHGRTRRHWRKLHLADDAGTSEITAHVLTDDAVRAPALLRQAEGRIASVIADGAYDSLAGLGGRLLLGVLADRHGAKPVLIGGLLLQALAIGAFLPARGLGEFYAVAAVFGLAYGGVMPLYAVLVRDCFGTRIMGTVFGAATMASCVGMAAGPAIGGWIFDRFGDYAGMHLASLAVGLGAVAIALTFSPLPRTRPERLKPA